MSSVPRVLHQTHKTRKLRGRLRALTDTCRAVHTHYAYRFYEDEDLRHEVARHAPRLLPAFDALELGIERADFGRYILMYAHGGVYLDTDMQCVAAVDPLLADGRPTLSLEPPEHGAIYGGAPPVCNSALMSAPGHPFWLALLDFIADTYPRVRRNPVYNTGPRVIDAFLAAAPQWRPQLRILDHCPFNGQADSLAKDKVAKGLDHQGLKVRGDQAAAAAVAASRATCDPSTVYAVHQWNHSWFSQTGPDKWRLAAFVIVVILCAWGLGSAIAGFVLANNNNKRNSPGGGESLASTPASERFRVSDR